MSLVVGKTVDCLNMHSWKNFQNQTKVTAEWMPMESTDRIDSGSVPKTDRSSGDINRKRLIIRIKIKKPQLNQDHDHEPVPMVHESKTVDDQTKLQKNVVCEPPKKKQKSNQGQIQKHMGQVEPSMNDRELVETVATAKRAADMVAMKRLPTTNPEFSRALNALSALKNFSVSYDSLKSTQVVKSIELLTKHPKVKIRTEAANMLQAWKKCPGPQEASKMPVTKKLKVGDQKTAITSIPKAFDLAETQVKKEEKETPKLSCNMREKIRGQLVEALSKVLSETKHETTKAKAKACDPLEIATSIESTMYKKMGQTQRDMAKCRSILFNLKDPNNPELRRRVLLVEIAPENLVKLTVEEMASSKRKRENEQIRLKGLIRCNAIKEEKEGTTEQFKCGDMDRENAHTISCRRGVLMNS